MEKGVAHLLEASIKLECNLEITAKALLLYHHSRRCCHNFSIDESMIAAVSISLAARTCEKPIDIDLLIIVFYSIVNQTTEVLSADDEAYESLKKSVRYFHWYVMRLLNFNLSHVVAHQYLVPFLSLIFKRNQEINEYREQVSASCVRLLNDFYLSRNCLDYKPDHTAAASIDHTLYLMGFTNDLDMPAPWYKGLSYDLTTEKIRKIRKDMMQVYKNINGGKCRKKLWEWFY